MLNARGWAPVVFAAGLLAAGEGALAGGYDLGYVWNRRADWTARPSGDHGTTRGNPDDDQLGNAVWSYEYFPGVPDGSDLDSGQPWYERTSTLLVWDNNFWDAPARWALGDNLTPCIASGWQTHQLSDSAWGWYDRVPVTRWVNPCSGPITVSISSGQADDFAILWWGHAQSGQPGPMAADVVIAKVDASQGDEISVLYSQTVTKPSNNYETERRPLDVLDLPAVSLDPGDELLFTARGRTRYHFTSGARLIGFYDDVSIEIVPEPAALALLALGGLAVMRRRR